MTVLTAENVAINVILARSVTMVNVLSNALVEVSYVAMLASIPTQTLAIVAVVDKPVIPDKNVNLVNANVPITKLYATINVSTPKKTP